MISGRSHGAADRDWEPTTLGSVLDLVSGGTPSKRRHGYPPDKQEQATRTVLEQAELLSEGWAAV